METEPLQVVVRVVQRADLQLAAVARARVHLPDVQRAPEEPAGAFVDPPREDFEPGVLSRPRQRLGHHGRLKDFSE